MEKKDYLQNASDECVFPNYRAVLEYMKSIGLKGEVKLVIAELTYHPEIFWYSEDNQIIKIIPAFKDYDKLNCLDTIECYSFDIISPKGYFFWSGKLYYLDEHSNINSVSVCHNEALARMYADISNLDVSSCSLIKLYTLGKTRDFITMAWLLKDDRQNMQIILPVFQEENDLINYEIGIPNLDYEYAKDKDFFIRNQQIWDIRRDDNGMQYIEKTQFCIISNKHKS